MTENTRVKEITHPEKFKSYLNLRFEPAIHSGGQEAWKVIKDKFLKGDVTAHEFNPEVAVRMRKYAPEIIALDGSMPDFLTFKLQDPTVINKVKGLRWVHLPARPLDINPKGEVYSITGDPVGFFYWGIEKLNLSHQKDTNDQLDQNYMLNTLYDKLKNLQDKYEKDETKNFLYNEVKAELYQYLIGVGITGATLLHAAPSIYHKKISRRKFLGYSAGVTVGLGLAATSFPTRGFSPIREKAKDIAYSTTDEKTKDLFQTVAGIFKPRFNQRDFLDARTALLISKTQDAIDYMGKPSDTPAAVVMGAEHIYEADTFLNDPKARARIINTFVSRLVPLFDEVVSKFPKLSKKDARNALLDYIAQVDIIKIKDPGGPAQNPNLPNLVDQLVTLIDSFQSPQVEAAIAQFRL